MSVGCGGRGVGGAPPRRRLRCARTNWRRPQPTRRRRRSQTLPPAAGRPGLEGETLLRAGTSACLQLTADGWLAGAHAPEGRLHVGDSRHAPGPLPVAGGGRGWGGGGQFACCVEHPGRNPLLPPADSLPAPCLPVSRLPAAASHLSGAGQPAVHHLRYIPKLDLPPAGAGGAGLMEKAVYSAAAVVNSTDHHDVHVD